MANYVAKIPKAQLVHGCYYYGRCRNATLARWNADKNLFYHWRYKFGTKFIETICHPEDDQQYDVFVVEQLCETPEIIIPFE